MLYDESETRWLDRRAVEIAARTGWPVPIARAEAAGQLARLRLKAPCPVARIADRAARREPAPPRTDVE